MEPLIILVLFFGILIFLLALTCVANRKRTRIIAAVCTFTWTCLIFIAARAVETFNLNAWYSSAAYELLDSTVKEIDKGNAAQASQELTHMRDQLNVTYENRGNFKDLATSTAERLNSDQKRDAEE